MKEKFVSIVICSIIITMIIPMTTSAEDNKVETLGKNHLYNLEFVDNQEQKYILSMIRASCFADDDELDQSQESYSGYGWGVWFDLMLAQSFVPTLEILTRVEMLMWKAGQPESIKISIRNDLDGEDLTSINVSASEISALTSWHEFNFPDIDVIPGQTYYIVWDPEGAFDIYNSFFWAFGLNNPYEKGCGWLFEYDIWEIWDPPGYPGLDFCFRTYGNIYRPSKPTITGPNSGKVDESNKYTFTSIHPKEENVSYYIEWGDGDITDWTVFQASGPPGYCENHSWSKKKTYKIKAKAKDVNGRESEWSDIFEVTIPKNKSFNFNFPLFSWLFDQFPNIFPILRYLLER